jgi:two-component system chemotaxis sensor kinase CheA
VLDDGGHAERSAHYHRYSTDFYLLALNVARATADPHEEAFHRAALAQARYLRAIGKGELDVEVIGAGVRLDPDVWGLFFSELSHVVRNAVDHGFEPVEERRTTGKTLRHTLVLRAELINDTLTFEVTDDGRGIDWGKIKESAKVRGLPHATQAQLLAALCSDGVTTRDGVTDISGRGVGMAAFRRRVDAMKGRLEVRSSAGAGTGWFVRFPWPPQGATRGSIPSPSMPPPQGATGT